MEDSQPDPLLMDATAPRPAPRPRAKRRNEAARTDSDAPETEPPASVVRVAAEAPPPPPPRYAETWYLRFGSDGFASLQSAMVKDGAMVRSRQYEAAEFMDTVAAPLRLCAAVMSAGSPPPASDGCKLHGGVLVQVAAVITDGWHFSVAAPADTLAHSLPPVHYRLLRGENASRLVATRDALSTGLSVPPAAPGGTLRPRVDSLFGVTTGIPAPIQEILGHTPKDVPEPCVLAVRTHVEAGVLRELDVLLIVFDVGRHSTAHVSAARGDPLADGMETDAGDVDGGDSDGQLCAQPVEQKALVFYSAYTKAKRRAPVVYHRSTAGAFVRAD